MDAYTFQGVPDFDPEPQPRAWALMPELMEWKLILQSTQI